MSILYYVVIDFYKTKNKKNKKKIIKFNKLQPHEFLKKYKLKIKIESVN